MRSNRRYIPLISSAKSLERGGGTLLFCLSFFPCAFEIFSSTPQRMKKRIINEGDSTDQDSLATEGPYSWMSGTPGMRGTC